MDAARAASAVAVAVATGAFDSAALTAYGADVVLPDLLAFPNGSAGSARVDPRRYWGDFVCRPG